MVDRARALGFTLVETIDCDLGKMHSQELPTGEAIAGMPGRKLINRFNADPRAPRHEGDADMRDPAQVMEHFFKQLKDGMEAMTSALMANASK